MHLELCFVSPVYPPPLFLLLTVPKRFLPLLPCRISLSTLCLLLAFAVCGHAGAAPQNKQQMMMQKRMEHRQLQMEEMRAMRQAERQRVKEVVRASLAEQRAQRGEVINERPIEQLRRMSPEEKMALRKQIREARREIYLQK